MHSEHKVYVLYDHPHLVKNVRNNLMKHAFNKDAYKAVVLRNQGRFHQNIDDFSVQIDPT